MMELVKRKRRLDESEAIYLMRHTFEGVKYMRDRSIIHRDLKLGNLFLSEKMVCCITGMMMVCWLS